MVGRPGVSRARVSLARSLRPITRTARREAESAATAAIWPALRIAFGVSIIAQSRVLLRRAVLPHEARGEHDRAGTVDLGQENGVRTGGGGGDQVGRPPRRMRTVHADDDFPAAEVALGRLDHLRPRRLFGVWRDRIFEVEDQRVRRQRRRLGQRLGVGAGHVEDAAARASKHDDLLTDSASI